VSNTVTSSWRQSTFTQRLDLLALVAALVIVCRLAVVEDISWIGWIPAAAAALVLTASRWPYGALWVLVGTSVMARFYIEIFGWKARPEHFAAGMVATGIVVWLGLSKQRVRLNQLDYWILAFIAINFISSVVGSSAPASTLRWALQNSLAVLFYFLIRILVRDLETLGKAFKILLAVGALESAYGIFCYISHQAFGTSFGMEIGQYLVDVAAPYGSMYEPNMFGAYAGCSAVMFLTLYLFKDRSRTGYLLGFLIASLATLLSFSRAALLGFVIAVCWVFWKARSAAGGKRRSITTIVVAAAIILAFSASALGVLRERFSNLFASGLAEETTITRFVVLEQALQEVPSHPLLGTGTASFNLSFDWASFVPSWAGDTTWIGNTPIRILHDTGLIGLGTLVGFFVSVWWKIRKKFRNAGSAIPVLVALAAGCLLYFICFQSTDGSVLAFSWVQLGFLASATTLVEGSTHNLASQGEA
jgi:O-antigen ligase